MSENVDVQIQNLVQTVRVLAVIGASLKLRSRNNIDPEVHNEIDLGFKQALGLSVTDLDERQMSVLLRTVDMAFLEGYDLFQHPDRSREWVIEDINLLQTQGEASRQSFRRVLSLAEDRPLLREALNGRFLDVGTGIGGIALEAAATCPRLLIDCIDIWATALTLARQNVADSSYANRISISHSNVTELEPGQRYTVVWLPTMFMRRQTVERGLDRIIAASASGAYLIAAIYTVPSDPLSATLAKLRTLRSGGDIISPEELENLLRSRGYIDVESEVKPLATFVLGRRG
jgi:predicted RNA methylase